MATILPSNSLKKLGSGANSSVVAATFCQAMDAASTARLDPGSVRTSLAIKFSQLVVLIHLHCASQLQNVGSLERAQASGVLPSKQTNNILACTMH